MKNKETKELEKYMKYDWKTIKYEDMLKELDNENLITELTQLSYSKSDISYKMAKVEDEIIRRLKDKLRD